MKKQAITETNFDDLIYYRKNIGWERFDDFNNTIKFF